MSTKGNSGRVNNDPNYKKRPEGDDPNTHQGEDIFLGKGKGMDKRRLKNEIDDNLYEAETVIEVTDDPAGWGEDLQIGFEDYKRADYKKSLKKYLKVIKKTYKWLKTTPDGKNIRSAVGLRSIIGMSKNIWDNACENSEEFKYYSDLIYDIIGGRIHELGVTDSKGQVFKIFSMKSHLPEEFSDRKEISTHTKIDIIQIKEGNKDDIAKAIEESTKRLKK